MYVLVVLLSVCATAGLPSLGAAQEYAQDQGLAAARSALEQARFEEAKRLSRELLERSDLPPATRNDALELAAIIDIAARDEAAAQSTLSELFARDPEHPRKVPDPGPAVEVAFARAKAHPAPVQVRFTADPQRDARGRLLLRVHLLEGRDAVDSLHALAFLPEIAEPVEVVAHPALREWVTLTLPTPAPSTREIKLVMDARAPSGFVLARAGSLEAPRAAPVPPPPASAMACESSKPLRKQWWLWTSLSIVVAGVALSAGLSAN